MNHDKMNNESFDPQVFYINLIYVNDFNLGVF
jgi:hypothetical protein